jgi:hypothetical protein
MTPQPPIEGFEYRTPGEITHANGTPIPPGTLWGLEPLGYTYLPVLTGNMSDPVDRDALYRAGFAHPTRSTHLWIPPGQHHIHPNYLLGLQESSDTVALFIWRPGITIPDGTPGNGKYHIVEGRRIMYHSGGPGIDGVLLHHQIVPRRVRTTDDNTPFNSALLQMHALAGEPDVLDTLFALNCIAE